MLPVKIKFEIDFCRLKYQFVELDFSNLIFRNSSTDQQGVKKTLVPLYSSYVYVLPWLLLCTTTLNVIWLKKNRANFATGDIFDDHLWVCILCNFFRTNAISNRLIIDDHFG